MSFYIHASMCEVRLDLTDNRLADHDAIAGLFGSETGICVASAEMYGRPLHPQEETLVARALPRRRREFAAGRAAARSALTRIGGPPLEILRGPRGEPIWPAGYAGSIAHCKACCAAVVVRADDSGVVSVGLDIEDGTALPQDLARRICRDAELEALAARRPLEADGPALVFSAKEALYKCYYPLAKTFLEFHDVELSYQASDGASGGTFSARLTDPALPFAAEVARFRGRWRAARGLIFTGVTLDPP